MHSIVESYIGCNRILYEFVWDFYSHLSLYTIALTTYYLTMFEIIKKSDLLNDLLCSVIERYLTTKRLGHLLLINIVQNTSPRSHAERKIDHKLSQLHNARLSRSHTCMHIHICTSIMLQYKIIQNVPSTFEYNTTKSRGFLLSQPCKSCKGLLFSAHSATCLISKSPGKSIRNDHRTVLRMHIFCGIFERIARIFGVGHD